MKGVVSRRRKRTRAPKYPNFAGLPTRPSKTNPWFDPKTQHVIIPPAAIDRMATEKAIYDRKTKQFKFYVKDAKGKWVEKK